MTPYADIADLDEDNRIALIGDYVMRYRKTAAFVTDSDPGKSDRYIQKLKHRYPGINIIGLIDGPVPNTVTVKVGPPRAENN